MRHERIKIIRDTNTVHNKTVCPWEIPILEFLFEEGNVQRTGEFVETDSDYPDAPSEFQRLTLTYDRDRKSGVPHVASVYGDAGRGVKALAEAIADARKADQKAGGVKASKAAAKSKRVAKAHAQTAEAAALMS